MNKTPQSKINNNIKWAKNNPNKVKQYKNKYKQKQKKLAREYIKDLKSKSCCKICGNNNIYCLDFHHKPNSSKKNTVSNLVKQGYSLDIIKQEIEKCDIICSNCHRTKHYTGKYIRNKKGKIIHTIKQKSICCQCGCNKVECLDFHHNNLNKIDGIGAMIRDKNITIQQLETEIKKCTILCSNCHRILHAAIS